MKILNWKLKIKNGGFSLMEIVVVIGIFAVVASTVLFVFPKLKNKESLEKDVSSTIALIRNARVLSVASKNSLSYGVHFDEDKAILFEGNDYVTGGANQKVINFSKQVYMPLISLNLGGNDVVFSRLTGNTFDYGDVVLSLKDDTSSTTITILETGVVQ